LARPEDFLSLAIEAYVDQSTPMEVTFDEA